MAFYLVRYHAYVNGPGASLTVECPVGGGATVERTLDVHDLVFGIDPSSPKRGDLWVATDDGLRWAPAGFDANPGDVIVVNCTAVDLPAQSGLAVTITRDGTFAPLQAASTGQQVQRLSPQAGPQDITGDVVIADTTSGDVVGVLPPAVASRTIRVGNLTGSGSFQVDPVDGELIGGEGTLVLGPGDRATLIAVEAGWEVW